MAYTKTNWVNDSSPYIDAANLNKIEQGIEDAHNGVLATQLTGLIPINGTPLATDSLLVAIGKLKNTADSQGGALESFDVPISSGWQETITGSPLSTQTFKKKSGVVTSSALMTVQAASSAIIATLPVALRPSYQVNTIAYVQIQGQSSFLPAPIYVKTNGEVGLVQAPPVAFGLVLDLTYFV